MKPLTASPAATPAAFVRPLEEADEAVLRSLFYETFVLGRPLPFDLEDGGRYERLCLDWYLGPGRDDAAVLEADGRVIGFALVCTDADANQRWVQAHAARYAVHSIGVLCRRNPRSDLATFHRNRLRDGWIMMRSPAPSFGAHAHVNVDPGALRGWAGLDLLAFVDERCRRAGLPGWHGEINAPVGKRARALERVIGPVVHRAPNHTLSWLADTPVERLTVARTLPAPAPAPAPAETSTRERP